MRISRRLLVSYDHVARMWQVTSGLKRVGPYYKTREDAERAAARKPRQAVPMPATGVTLSAVRTMQPSPRTIHRDGGLWVTMRGRIRTGAYKTLAEAKKAVRLGRLAGPVTVYK